MHVIVGGCGRLGAEIATRFSTEGEDVVVLDVEETAFDRLGTRFNGETLVGSVTDRDVLEQGGIATADGLLAVTRFDNANLMAVEIATHIYGVDRAVARLFNPQREASYRKLGVRYVSGTALLAKQFVNEFRQGTFRLHLAFEYGDVEVVEMTVGPIGQRVRVMDFEAVGRLRVGAIQRGDRVFLPRSEDTLEEGDLVVAAVGRGSYQRIEPLLDLRSREGHPNGGA
ncbi:MAG TPA: TrkA family potassium uptake protein [Nitriliruptorales bacterium]|nr:TrkA family potassium uptake protein [Nitriliruptorales bacterium]